MGKICDKSYTVTASGFAACCGSNANIYPITEIVETVLLPPFKVVPVPSGIFRFGQEAFGMIITDKNNQKITNSGCFGAGNANVCGYWGNQTFSISWVENNINCRCSDDSCRVDCITQPDGFCCVDHSVTNRLIQVLQN